MSLPPDDASEAAADLLGRWSAHHRGEQPPSPAPEAEVETPLPADPDAPPEEPAPPKSQPGKRAARHAAPSAPAAAGSPSWMADHVEASREVVEALGIPPARHEPQDPPPDDGATAVGRHAAAPAPGPSTDVEFHPRRAVRLVLGVLLLALLAATVAAGLWAYDERTTLSYGIAGTLLVATLVVYGVRASSSPAHLRIHAGQLEVVRGRERDVFDLSSRFTHIEESGTPGHRGWKVVCGRFGRSPVVIDRSMVDPHQFSAALARHRPSTR